METSRPPHISIRVLGGGRDVGRSCMLLTLGERQVLLDCGAHPGFADSRRFPDLKSLPALDAVLVTHFHLDHAGALPQMRALQRQGATALPAPPIVMTRPTRRLTALMLRDFWEMSNSRHQEMPFSSEDVRTSLDAVAEVELGETFSPANAPDLSICAYYAGHVLGAVMFRISVRGFGCVVYSGDYTTSPDSLLRGAEIPVLKEPVDLFITEATYCSTIRRAPRSASESELFEAIAETLETRGKVLIPVAALGRAQDMIAALAPLWMDADGKHDMSHVPIHIAAGLMSKAATVYDSFPEWTSSHVAEAGERRAPQLCEFQRGRDWGRITEEGPMVLFATPGSLSSGLAYDVFRVWAGNARNLVVVPGFCFANTLAARVLSGAKRGDGIEDIRCRLMNMSFSGHADARGIVRTVRRLAPRAVMLCHGEEKKILAYAPRLRKALGGHIPVHAPANGDVLNLEQGEPFKGDGEKVEKTQRALLAYVKEGTRTEWQIAVDQYMQGAGEKGKYHFGRGNAHRPIHDGVGVLSQLYAELLPNICQVDTSLTHLRYKEQVEVMFEESSGLVRLSWEEPSASVEAMELWQALEALCSAPLTS